MFRGRLAWPLRMPLDRKNRCAQHSETGAPNRGEHLIGMGLVLLWRDALRASGQRYGITHGAAPMPVRQAALEDAHSGPHVGHALAILESYGES
jgi:hypothetical protein